MYHWMVARHMMSSCDTHARFFGTAQRGLGQRAGYHELVGFDEMATGSGTGYVLE